MGVNNDNTHLRKVAITHEEEGVKQNRSTGTGLMTTHTSQRTGSGLHTPTASTPASDLRATFNQLLSEHYVLAVTSMMKGYDGAAVADQALDQNGGLDNGQTGVLEHENRVGWFEPGVTPGNKGNTVIAGHVDSKTDPANDNDSQYLSSLIIILTSRLFCNRYHIPCALGDSFEDIIS